ncbi:MAG: mechanosensitive ion channel family protein [Planctomycetota bacterium]
MTEAIARRAAWAAVLLLAAYAPLARAQDDEPDPERKHARATFHAFAKAAAQAKNDPEKMKRALLCLDLSEVADAKREETGRERVVQLAKLLGEVKHIPEQLIPDDPKGDAFVVYQDPDTKAELAIDRVGRNWRFTSGSVAAIPAIYRAAEARRLARQQARKAGAPPPPEPGTAPPPATAPPAAAAAPRFEHLHDWLRARVPDAFKGRAFLLEYWQWLGLLILGGIGVLLHLFVVLVLSVAIVKALEAQEMEADRQLTKQGVRPFGLLVMAAFWWVGIGWLGLHADVLRFVTITIQTVAAIAGVWGAYRLVDVVCSALERKALESESKFDDLLVPLVRKSLKVAVVAFGAVFIADTLQFSIKSLLAGLGLGGLAFALAAQDTVKNFFGSLTVVLDRPFEVGDWVLIDGIEGSVEEVGFRSTRIRTFYDSVITIPNAKLLTAVVDNMGRRAYRRWKAKLGVAYHTTPEQLEALTEGIRELIRCHPYTRKDYFQIWVTGFGDSAIEILIYAFFETPDWTRELRERQRLILDMLRLCEQLEIEIAFPTQTIHVVNAPEAKAAERAAEDAVRAKSTVQAQDVGRAVAQRVLEPAARTTARLAAIEKAADRLREEEEQRRKDEELQRQEEAQARGAVEQTSTAEVAPNADEAAGGDG